MRLDFEDMQSSQIIESEHKPVQPLKKKELRICNNFRCHYETNEPVSKCPKCRRPIWTINEFRLLMSLLIPCGGFFVAVGLGLIFALEYNASAWTSGKAAFYFVYGIAGLLIASGLSVISLGLWGVIFGRPNRVLTKFMVFGFIGLLLIVGFGKLILTILSD